MGRSDATEKWAEMVFALEPRPMQEARRLAEMRKIRPIEVTAHEGKTIQLLLSIAGARRAVEIGTLYGYSALWMIRGLGAEGHLWTCERDPEHADAAATVFRLAGVEDQITIVQGDAATTLPSLSEHAPFDAVFIDADKERYPYYLEWAENTVRRGGLIFGHNAYAFGRIHEDPSEVPEEEREAVIALQAFNRRLADPERFQAVLVPTVQGLTVARKLM